MLVLVGGIFVLVGCGGCGVLVGGIDVKVDVFVEVAVFVGVAVGL